MGTTSAEALALGVQALNAKLRQQVQRYMLISRFMGDVKTGMTNNNSPWYEPSGMPIEVNNMLGTPGIGDSMLIPMFMSYTGEPRYGDATLIGTEEPNALYYTWVQYNKIRKAITNKDGEMADSRMDILDIYSKAMPGLAEYFGKMENWQFITSVYEGVSENLSCAVADDTYGQGLGVSKIYHPNMYHFTGASASAGVITRIGTAGALPTAAEIYAAASGGSASNPLAMTTDTLEAFSVQLENLGIRKLVNISGFQFWPIYITPEQHMTLLRDTAYKAAISSILWKELAQNPLINGAVGMYGSFVIFSDPIAVRGYAGTSGSDLNIIGTETQVSSRTAKRSPKFLPMKGRITNGGKSNHVAFVLGQSAFGKAVKGGLSYRDQDYDYGNVSGLAGVTSYGYRRLDWVPQDQQAYLKSAPASITQFENESSALLMTWQ